MGSAVTFYLGSELCCLSKRPIFKTMLNLHWLKVGPQRSSPISSFAEGGNAKKIEDGCIFYFPRLSNIKFYISVDYRVAVNIVIILHQFMWLST